MAKMQIGKLSALLTLNSANFKKGISGAGKSLGGFGKSILNVGKQVRRFGMVMGAAAVAGMVSVVKSTLASIDSLAKFSGRIGININKLRQMEYAAGITGSSVSDLRTSMEKMVKNVAEASTGLGIGKRAMDRLGLSAKAMIRLSPDEQFLAISDAMGGLETQSEKVLTTMEIFGRSGGGLVNMLGLGSGGVKELMRTFEAFSRELSGKDVKAVEGFNDKIVKLRGHFQKLKDQLTIAWTPLMIEWAEGLIKFGDKFSNLSEDQIKVVKGYAKWGAVLVGLMVALPIVSHGVTALTGVIKLSTLALKAWVGMTAAAGGAGLLAGTLGKVGGLIALAGLAYWGGNKLGDLHSKHFPRQQSPREMAEERFRNNQEGPRWDNPQDLGSYFSKHANDTPATGDETLLGKIEQNTRQSVPVRIE